MSLVAIKKQITSERVVRAKRVEKAQAAYDKIKARAREMLVKAGGELESAKKDLTSFNTDMEKILGKAESSTVAAAPTPTPSNGKPAVKAPAKLVAAKAKARKVPAKAKGASTPKGSRRATLGRREVAEGKRPKIMDAIAIVMADKTMDSQQVYEALKAKDWLPSSDNPRQYIGQLLSWGKKEFERVSRGKYRVRPGQNIVSGTPAATPVMDADKVLAEVGLSPA